MFFWLLLEVLCLEQLICQVVYHSCVIFSLAFLDLHPRFAFVKLYNHFDIGLERVILSDKGTPLLALFYFFVFLLVEVSWQLALEQHISHRKKRLPTTVLQLLLFLPKGINPQSQSFEIPF